MHIGGGESEVAPGEQGPQMMQERVLFGGLTTLFSLLGVLITPFLYIAPIPLGVITFRQGMRVGTIIAFIAGAVTGVFIGGPMALATVILLLAMGLALGGSMREGQRPGQTLVVGSVVSIIVIGTFLYTLLNVLGVGSINELLDQLQELMGEQFEGYINQLRLVYPAAVIAGSVFYTFFNMWGVHRVLGAIGTETPWFPPIRTWRLPIQVALLFLLVQALGFIALPDTAHTVLVNVAYLLSQAFVVVGIAVAAFYVAEWGWHPAITIVCAIFALTVPWGSLTAVLVGLIDSGFNLRRHREV